MANRAARAIQAFLRLSRRQKGITGLETAIILIAFVVVASVFSYSVLSAGIFSSEKSKEAIHESLDTVRSSMEFIGGIVAEDTDQDGNVNQIIFTVSTALSGHSVDLTVTTDSDSDGLLSDESTKIHSAVVSYFDQQQRIGDMAWTTKQVGRGDSDSQLETAEKFEITVDMTALATGQELNAYDTFTIELKPGTGSALTFERTLPAAIDKITDLN